MLSCNSANSGSGFKPSTNKRAIISVYEDEVNEKELGEETAAEKHLKILLQKQLNTKLSVTEQFAQHRTFSCRSTYNSLAELIRGSCTLDRFKEIEKDEDLHQELQRCGLGEKEIADYLLFKSGKKKGRYGVDPAVWADTVKSIEEKIKAHNEELLEPQAFKNVKKLTRHEMEIEKSLYAGCPAKKKLSTLVSVMGEKSPADVEAAFKHIQSLSREKRSHQLDFQYDPNIHHVIVPLEEQEVKEKRLSIDEIKKLPKFENYEAGNPNKTLYLKNLHPKTTVHELRSLFGGFEGPVDYKICTGRMKGQAFVKFASVESAERALQHANGYSLRGKPLIIAFGRSS